LSQIQLDKGLLAVYHKTLFTTSASYDVLFKQDNSMNDENLGDYCQILSAKSSISGQDGGVATSLLLSGVQKGLFEVVIVVQRTEGYHAKAVATSNIFEIIQARGTKYLRVPILGLLNDLVAKGKRKIAIVGSPCQVQAARKIQQKMLTAYPDLQLAIVGLFCFEAFDHEKLKDALQKQIGRDLDKVEKTQIHKGKFIVTFEGKESYIKVHDLYAAQENGCSLCKDLTNKFADISVGSVGSPAGYSTVIVRSEIGQKLLDGVDLVKGEVNKDEIIKLALIKTCRAADTLAAIG